MTGSRPDGVSEPPGAAGHPPAVGIASELHAGDSGRKAQAIEWAKQQLGRTDCKGASLWFVSYAFGGLRPYPTATIAATGALSNPGTEASPR